MSPQIKRVTESCVLSEGPHWDAKSESLFYVDIFGKAILKYTPETEQLTKASTAPKKVSFIIPVDNSNHQFVVALDNELTLISWDGDNLSIIDKLATADGPPGESITFNDAKCDATGRLWTGTYGQLEKTIDSLKPIGSLYSFDANRKLKAHVGNIRASNGIAINEQARKFYYVDSWTKAIDQFDLDTNAGTISNRQILFALPEHGIAGIPDGITIDTDGNLWVAVFGAYRVIKIDGSQPQTLLDTIELPTPQVTSVAFGGKNLDELYVTTGAFEFEGLKPEPPVNGAVYRITGTGSRGFPADTFKLN